MKQIKIYGIGNPIIDLNYRVTDADLQRLDRKKGIMHLVDEGTRDRLLSGLGSAPDSYAAGGDCPNVMVSTALLGTPTAFSGKVGEDDFGRMYEERLAETGVLSNLSFGDGKTGSSLILVSPDGERTMNTYLGQCQHFGPENVARHLIMQAQALFVTGYFWDTPGQKDAMNVALGMAESLDKVVIFDAADPYAVGRSREDFLWLLDKHVDVLFANHEEARALTGMDSAEDCARHLAGKASCGAVKIGAKGAWVFLNGELALVPAFPVANVVDTTGAGDTFAAGFLHGLNEALTQPDGTWKPIQDLRMAEVIRAGRTAAFVAALIICRVGPQIRLDEAELIRKSLQDGPGSRFVLGN